MTVNQPLVAIGIPSGDMVHADFAMTLANFCINPGARIFLLNAKSSLVAFGRNQCVTAALLAKATHLLFLDTDMIFPLNTLSRLLAHQKDIIGAVYSQRAAPFHPLGVMKSGEHKHVPRGVHPMAMIPTGCLLIRTHVFEKLSKPWFNTIAAGDSLLGEDYFFCHNAIAAGMEIWCDGDLSRELGHIGQKIYQLGD